MNGPRLGLLRPRARAAAPLLVALDRLRSPLTVFGAAMVALTVFFAVGIAADDRIVTGAPAWLKPTKFGISIALYTLTLAWLLGFVRLARAWARRVVDATVWTLIGTFTIEMVLIVVQVVRGTTSHFNVATTLDAAIYGAMSVSIVILWGANFVLAAVLAFARFERPAFGAALRSGLTIATVGMGLGFLMTAPTAEQAAGWREGAAVTIVGAHAVGVPDGGPGLPVTGWSTEGGDLRVAHFVGLHGLQVIPLFGAWVVRRRRWSDRQQTRLVAIASASFLALVGLVAWQALRGQSIVAPDVLTLAALIGLAVATSTAFLWAARPIRAATPASLGRRPS